RRDAEDRHNRRSEINTDAHARLCVGLFSDKTRPSGIPAMKLSRLIPAFALLLAVPGFAPAQEKLPDVAKVAKLDVRPARVELNGPFAYAQLLVTATLDNGETADVTRIAKIDAPASVVAHAGLVRPSADGSGEIAISLGGQSVKVPTTVTGFKDN